MSVEAIAVAAGVGKPAIYRRYPDKAALVAAVHRGRLPALDVPDLGDTRAELWQAVERGFPADGAAYVGLIGGLIAEQERHPELIDAFRRFVLLPRRAVGLALVERGQQRGDVRRDIGAEAALDLFAGPFLARVFAGLDAGAPVARNRVHDLVDADPDNERNAMIDFTLETHIDQPVSEVFAYATDPEKLSHVADEHRLGGRGGRRSLAPRDPAARGAPSAGRQGARVRSSRSRSSSPTASSHCACVEGTPDPSADDVRARDEARGCRFRALRTTRAARCGCCSPCSGAS